MLYLEDFFFFCYQSNSSTAFKQSLNYNLNYFHFNRKKTQNPRTMPNSMQMSLQKHYHKEQIIPRNYLIQLFPAYPHGNYRLKIVKLIKFFFFYLPDKYKLFDCLYSWKNWVIRGIFTFLMIGGFCLIIYGGPLALMITVSDPLLMINNFFFCQSIKKNRFINPTGFNGTSKMFRRNYKYWLRCVQDSRFTMVSFVVLVFFNYIQLFFLR